MGSLSSMFAVSHVGRLVQVAGLVNLAKETSAALLLPSPAAKKLGAVTEHMQGCSWACSCVRAARCGHHSSVLVECLLRPHLVSESSPVGLQ